MKEQIVPFLFPIRGLNENWARHDQPGLTTPDLLNVRVYDRQGRARGAQRPGTRKLFADPLGDNLTDLYRQARRCTNDTLAPLYVNIDEIAAYPYSFVNQGDGQCYYVLEAEPTTPSPSNIARNRTPIDDCNDPICSGGVNPPLYRQVRKCSDNSLVQLYIDISRIAAYPFYFQWDGDQLGYVVLDTDPTTPTPTFVAVNITPLTGCNDPLLLCTDCAPFSWDTGTVREHLQGGSISFIRTSPTAYICTVGITAATFAATSDDFVAMIHATDDVTQTYSGTAGDSVTITLPADAIIFRDTTGYFIGTSSTPYRTTVAKTFEDGTNTYTFPTGSAPPLGGTGHVVDMEAGGFVTRPWAFGVTTLELSTLGWADADGVARVKFVHVVSGGGRANITSLTCGGTSYIKAYECGGSGRNVPIADVPHFPFSFLDGGTCFTILESNPIVDGTDGDPIVTSPVEAVDCAGETGTTATEASQFQTHLDNRAIIAGGSAPVLSGISGEQNRIDAAVDYLASICNNFVDPAAAYQGGASTIFTDSLWDDASFRAALSIGPAGPYALADIANGLRLLVWTTAGVTNGGEVANTIGRFYGSSSGQASPGAAWTAAEAALAYSAGSGSGAANVTATLVVTGTYAATITTWVASQSTTVLAGLAKSVELYGYSVAGVGTYDQQSSPMNTEDAWNIWTTKAVLAAETSVQFDPCGVATAPPNHPPDTGGTLDYYCGTWIALVKWSFGCVQ